MVTVGVPTMSDAPAPIRYGWYGGATPQPHFGHRSLLDDFGARLRVVHREPGAPFEVADERGPELGIAGQVGVVGGEAHQGGKPEPLLGGDGEVEVVGQHGVVPTARFGVGRGAAEDLAPPFGHMLAVFLAHAAGKQGRQQVVTFDPVIEGVDHPADRLAAAGPGVERWGSRHRSIVLTAP